MKKLFTLFVVFLVALSVKAQEIADTNSTTGPTVRTQNGLVRGTTDGAVSIFKGIPYAAPPVGGFRWRPPQPAKSWEGIRDASQFGSNCAQGGWGAAPGTIAAGSSEDCLYLNLWEAADFNENDKRPVMVWIHGGGFTGGSGAGQADFGSQFARQGVILVSINYRLGRLGHFAFPALSAEHPEEPKGSYAFMDQIAALRWVQENISVFGGDPNNVTIFGQSAGGVSIHSLLSIPAAKGLFQKAIAESSGGRDGVLTGRPISQDNADALYPVSAETIGINFARKHDIEGTDAAALAKLRALPVEAIVDGGQETDGQGGPRIYSGPILDGQFVVETAESAYREGRQARVPLIIGNCSAEIGGAFVSTSSTKEALFSQFGELEQEAKAAYDPDGKKEFDEVITKFNTDWAWGEPARMTARAFVTIGEPTYVYHFDFVPAGMAQWARYGAGHGSEVGFVFGNLTNRDGSPLHPTEKELAGIMNSYWVNFAKNGNPNAEGLPEWPAYNTPNQEILDVQPDGKPVGKPDPRKARLDLIEKAVKSRPSIQTRGGI
ncbi:carboxylesterase/lipase family protein [Mangrovibacterium sp.]|uniref:carboxylesterase/lipase family protein n=1 Tax=Mangrovibacterium sp. TaxID=1961364 RepID=UPI0035626C91